MERITSTDAVGSLPAASESGSPGYFTNGDPGVPTPATTVTAEFLNRVQEEICGVVEGAGLTLDPNDNGQLLAAIQAILGGQVGNVAHHFGSTAPSGWVIRNGTTIGSATSGATQRANADTAALFAHIWANTANTGDFIIQDSAGAGSTRGASAAADFAANKRMPLPDDRGLFDRGLNTSGGGYDSGRALASTQADAFEAHAHDTVSDDIVGDVAWNGTRKYTAKENPSASLSGTSVAPTLGESSSEGGTETRPANRAYLPIIKL